QGGDVVLKDRIEVEPATGLDVADGAETSQADRDWRRLGGDTMPQLTQLGQYVHAHAAAFCAFCASMCSSRAFRKPSPWSLKAQSFLPSAAKSCAPWNS